jgi:osmotically-inducible protein OsmY
MTRLTVLSVGLLAVLLAAPAAPASYKPPSDDLLKSRVEQGLAAEDLRAVTVAVKRAVVTLTGNVPSVWARTRAVHIAEAAKDVKSVLDQLTVAAAASDTNLALDVTQQVSRAVFYTVFDSVNVAVKDGVVSLSGLVVDERTMNEMVDATERLAGVKQVVNGIEILPASGVDQELRLQVAARIYTHPTFARYGLRKNPPIHMVVKSSRVRLVGVVDSEVAKSTAEVIVKETPGVLAVTSELRVE